MIKEKTIGVKLSRNFQTVTVEEVHTFDNPESMEQEVQEAHKRVFAEAQNRLKEIAG